MDDRKGFDDFNPTPVDTELEATQAAQEEVLDENELIRSLSAGSRRDERVIAFYLTYASDRFDYMVDIEDLLENFRQGFDIPVPADSFAVELARGAIQERDALDEQIKPHLKNWKLERLGCCTRLILRLALWELTQPEAIHSIVINEAVELAKRFAEKDAYKFINGILDEICKINKYDERTHTSEKIDEQKGGRNE